MIRSMKAILVKETRENLRWAGLIFLIVSCLLAIGLCVQLHGGMSIMGPIFLVLSMLMFPAAGFSLGLVQVFQDTRQGRWQFITHRPVSRGRLFAGKVLVGAGMYLAATVAPLAAAILWVATPGHVPGPFAWDMTEPVLAYLLAGLMWYAAGLLIVARTARWIGSRIIPLGGAIVGSFAVQLCAMTLLQAIAIIVIFVAVMLSAAWGAFVAGGETSRFPRSSKPLVGLNLFVGWTIAIMLLMGIGASVIQMLRAPRDFSARNYYLTSDGQIQIWTTHNGVLEKIEDPAGHAMPIPPDIRWNRNHLSQTTLAFPEGLNGRPFSIFRAADEGFLNADTHLFPVGYSKNWSYVVSRQTVEGYDERTSRFLGSLGPDGFAGPDRAPQAFPQPFCFPWNAMHSDLNVLVFPDAAYRIEIPTLRLRRLYASAADDPIVVAQAFVMDTESDQPAPGEPEYSVVATQTSIHILEGDRSLMTLRIERDDLDPGGEITVGRTNSGQFVVAYGVYEPALGYGPLSVSIYTHDGALVHRTDVPASPQPPAVDPDEPWDEIAFFSLLPPAISAVGLPIDKLNGRPMPLHAMSITLISAIGYAAIGFTMLRCRHASRRQFYVWTLLTVALGLCGILMMLSMMDRVRSVRCPACGKRRLLTESACPHCRTPVAPPPMLGIEIFEPVMPA